MNIGVDSSLIVAAVHANHPRHALAAGWLTSNVGRHHLVVAHHSLLETYAVLTRLPGDMRVTPAETRDLLTATVRANMVVAVLPEEAVWSVIDSFVLSSVIGGRSYDAIILHTLRSAGVDAIATFNPSHFAGLAPDLRILDPADPKE